MNYLDGTLTLMSPEYVRDETLDASTGVAGPRGDLWARPRSQGDQDSDTPSRDRGANQQADNPTAR